MSLLPTLRVGNLYNRDLVGRMISCMSPLYFFLLYLPSREVRQGGKANDSAIFVTWNTIRPGHGSEPRLRGCIGTFAPMPLAEGLKEYALIRFVLPYLVYKTFIILFSLTTPSLFSVMNL